MLPDLFQYQQQPAAFLGGQAAAAPLDPVLQDFQPLQPQGPNTALAGLPDLFQYQQQPAAFLGGQAAAAPLDPVLQDFQPLQPQGPNTALAGLPDLFQYQQQPAAFLGGQAAAAPLDPVLQDFQPLQPQGPNTALAGLPDLFQYQQQPAAFLGGQAAAAPLDPVLQDFQPLQPQPALAGLPNLFQYRQQPAAFLGGQAAAAPLDPVLQDFQPLQPQPALAGLPNLFQYRQQQQLLLSQNQQLQLQNQILQIELQLQQQRQQQQQQPGSRSRSSSNSQEPALVQDGYREYDREKLTRLQRDLAAELEQLNTLAAELEDLQEDHRQQRMFELLERWIEVLTRAELTIAGHDERRWRESTNAHPDKLRGDHLKFLTALLENLIILFCIGSWSSRPDKPTDEHNPARAVQNRYHIHSQHFEDPLMVIWDIDGFVPADLRRYRSSNFYRSSPYTHMQAEVKGVLTEYYFKGLKVVYRTLLDHVATECWTPKVADCLRAGGVKAENLPMGVLMSGKDFNLREGIPDCGAGWTVQSHPGWPDSGMSKEKVERMRACLKKKGLELPGHHDDSRVDRGTCHQVTSYLLAEWGRTSGFTVPLPNTAAYMDEDGVRKPKMLGELPTVATVMRLNNAPSSREVHAGQQAGNKALELGLGWHGRTSEQRAADGKKGGKKAVELGLGWHGRTSEQRAADGQQGGKKAVELGLGWHGRTSEQRAADGQQGGKKGGKKAVEMRAGVHSWTSEQLGAAGKKGGIKLAEKMGTIWTPAETEALEKAGMDNGWVWNEAMTLKGVVRKFYKLRDKQQLEARTSTAAAEQQQQQEQELRPGTAVAAAAAAPGRVRKRVRANPAAAATGAAAAPVRASKRARADLPIRFKNGLTDEE
ncbi:hypothetical protein N2152v2_009841 [Parachlorella kessleri]